MSQVAYDPSDGGANGRIKDVEVYVSLDGKSGLYLVKLLTGQIIKKEKILKLSEPEKSKICKNTRNGYI